MNRVKSMSERKGGEMTETRSVSTQHAPRAIGPYSQAVEARGWLFLSGQIALDPSDGRLVGATAAEQTEQVLDNLQAVLEAGGSGLAKVVKTTIYLVDLADFQFVNELYAKRFGSARPARATVQVAALPLGAKVEIDAVALANETHGGV